MMTTVETNPPKGNLLFQIINNSISFLGGEFFYRFVNFFACILIARTLGQEKYGQFSFIYVYLSFFEVFVQFGLNAILVRQISQNPKNAPRILGNAFLIRTVLVLFSLPVAFYLIRWLGYPLSIQQGVFLAYFQLFLTLRPIFETVFRVKLLMIYPALWNGLRALINLAFVALVAFAHPSLPYFILAYLASGFIGFFGFMIFSRRFIQLDFRVDKSLVINLIKESAPLAFSAYLTLLYYRTDVFMLSKMKTFLDVGYYSVGTRLTEALNMLPSALLISFFPLISCAFKENREHFERLITRAFETLLLAGFPIALGGSLFGREIISLFFGQQYAPAATAFILLCWYTCFCFLGSLLANVLIACGRQIKDMWLSLFLVFLNISANLFLIPKYSYNGAALATLLTEGAGVALYFVCVSRDPEIKLVFPLKGFLTAFKVNLPFLVILICLKTFFRIHVIFDVIAGIFVYGGLLLFFKVVSWNDLREYIRRGIQARGDDYSTN